MFFRDVFDSSVKLLHIHSGTLLVLAEVYCEGSPWFTHYIGLWVSTVGERSKNIELSVSHLGLTKVNRESQKTLPSLAAMGPGRRGHHGRCSIPKQKEKANTSPLRGKRLSLAIEPAVHLVQRAVKSRGGIRSTSCQGSKPLGAGDHSERINNSSIIAAEGAGGGQSCPPSKYRSGPAKSCQRNRR